MKNDANIILEKEQKNKRKMKEMGVNGRTTFKLSLKIWRSVMGWSNLAQDRSQGRAVVNTVGFVDYLRDRKLLKIFRSWSEYLLYTMRSVLSVRPSTHDWAAAWILMKRGTYVRHATVSHHKSVLFMLVQLLTTTEPKQALVTEATAQP